MFPTISRIGLKLDLVPVLLGCHLVPVPCTPWRPWLEVRWWGINDADSGGDEQQAHVSTPASSANTHHQRPIGPKKASLLNSSFQLAGIVCISNSWSLVQSSIRSSCRSCAEQPPAPAPAFSIFITTIFTISKTWNQPRCQ